MNLLRVVWASVRAVRIKLIDKITGRLTPARLCCLEQRIDVFDNFGFWLVAYQCALNFTIFEEDQGRNTADAELLSEVRSLVYVNFYDVGLAIHFSGDFIENR